VRVPPDGSSEAVIMLHWQYDLEDKPGMGRMGGRQLSISGQPLSADPKIAAPYRRVAWRFIPFLIVCYACAIVDRLNVKAVNCPGYKLRVFDVKEENGALFVRPAG
jgi:hypothetical protein